MKNKIIHFLIHSPFGRFFSDKTAIIYDYQYTFSVGPDLNNPTGFNEKIQWIKLYDRKNDYIEWVDKDLAKKKVSALLGEKAIIKTLGIWKSFDDIDFSLLPNRFVLKCTHDSGSVVICTNKDCFDYEKAKNILNKGLRHNHFYNGREWAYKRVKPAIIAEEFLDFENSFSLLDYKFFCFNGEPKLFYISKSVPGSMSEMSFFDLKGNILPFKRKDHKQLQNYIIPQNLDEMIETSKKLAIASRALFVRVDLYSNGKILLFSELTFYPGNGLLKFDPSEWDLKLGEYLQLPLE